MVKSRFNYTLNSTFTHLQFQSNIPPHVINPYPKIIVYPWRILPMAGDSGYSMCRDHGNISMNMEVVVSQQKLIDCGDGQYKLTVEVNWDGDARNLWMMFPECFVKFVNLNTYDWVMASLLIPAMRAGLHLIIRGRVSTRLYRASNYDLQKIFMMQNESLRKIDVTADEVCRSDMNTSSFTGVGFSAGVDSLSSLAILGQHPATRPSHLVTLNVGAMGENGHMLLPKYANRVREFAENFGYSDLAVDSNISDFYKSLSFISTHTIRTASAILSLGSAFKDYYYSSGRTYESVGVRLTNYIATSDPIILPLLSNECVQFHAIGTHLSRLEKVRLLCDFEASFEVLDVCTQHAHERISRPKPNCLNCYKCLRQLISLELLGVLDNFEVVFDLEGYKKNRRGAMYQVAMRALANDKQDIDVLLLAQEKNRLTKFQFPWALRIAKVSWKLRHLLAKFIAKDFCVKTN